MAKDKICKPFLAISTDKFTVDTIDDLKSRNYLTIGDIVELNGYYTAGDGAGHKRKIEEIDDGSGVQLANGLWANIVHNGEVNVSWFGAKGDGVTDDTVAIQKAFNFSENIKFDTKFFIFGKVDFSRQKTLNLDINNAIIIQGSFIIETDNDVCVKNANVDYKNTYSNYTSFLKITSGGKICVTNISFKNLLDLRGESFWRGIWINTKPNTDIFVSDIFLKNIKLKGNSVVGDVIGEIRGVFIYADHTQVLYPNMYMGGGIIQRVFSEYMYNVDENGIATVEDSDLVVIHGRNKTSDGYLKNSFEISDVKTFNTGKRLVKSLSSGTIIKNIISSYDENMPQINTGQFMVSIFGDGHSVEGVHGNFMGGAIDGDFVRCSIQNIDVVDVRNLKNYHILANKWEDVCFKNVKADCNNFINLNSEAYVEIINSEIIYSGKMFVKDKMAGLDLSNCSIISTSNISDILTSLKIRECTLEIKNTKTGSFMFYSNSIDVDDILINAENANKGSVFQVSTNSPNVKIKKVSVGYVNNSTINLFPFFGGDNGVFMFDSIFELDKLKSGTGFRFSGNTNNINLRNIKTSNFQCTTNNNGVLELDNVELGDCTFSSQLNILQGNSSGTIISGYPTIVNKWTGLVRQNIYVKLDTPYYTTKMQQEGVYEDFIQYMDEKTEYDRVQREQPEGVMMLPVIEEPQPSEKLLAFKEKYLG